MKVQVNRKYMDGVGCTVKIVAELKNRLYPMVGVIDWTTCKDQSSREADPEIEYYDRSGKCQLGNAYCLTRRARRRR